jgi:hypothetical protein
MFSGGSSLLIFLGLPGLFFPTTGAAGVDTEFSNVAKAEICREEKIKHLKGHFKM